MDMMEETEEREDKIISARRTDSKKKNLRIPSTVPSDASHPSDDPGGADTDAGADSAVDVGGVANGAGVGAVAPARASHTPSPGGPSAGYFHGPAHQPILVSLPTPPHPASHPTHMRQTPSVRPSTQTDGTKELEAHAADLHFPAETAEVNAPQSSRTDDSG
jgi:hypothetical protein